MKSFICTLLIGGVFNFAIAQSTENSKKNNVNNTSKGYLENLYLSSPSNRIDMPQIQPCAGSIYSNSYTYKPGMFIFDGDFEGFINSSHGVDKVCVSTDYTKTHEIATLQDNTCLPSTWKASHGTPELGINNGNHFLHIWSGNWTNDGDFEGEGVFFDCPLLFCAYYSISLKLSSKGSIDKVYFYLASGIQNKVKDGNEFNAESAFYKVPSVTSSQLLYTITNFNSGSGNWVNIDIPVFKPNSPDMKLWIFTEDSNVNVGAAGQSPDLLFIDNVNDGILGSSTTCSGSINYNNSGITVPNTTKALDITASVPVSQNGATEFIAGSFISLQSGFIAGANFKASIIKCANSNNCPSILPYNLTASGSETEAKIEAEGDVTVYPNPAANHIFIGNLVNEEIKSVTLFSLVTGQEFKFDNIIDQEGVTKVELGSELQKGISILKISTDKKTYYKKIVVE